MAAAEALMELVPSKGGNNRVEPEDEKEKERVMAATYAAYTKRAKLQAEKTKAQQLSRQLKTRLQFARLKVDYGWTRQSLNEVENLYFHLSRARPTPQQHQQRAETATPPVPAPSTPPIAMATPTESQEQESQEQSTQSTQIESPSLPASQTTPSLPSAPAPQLPVAPTSTPPAQTKRTPFVERTRTGGIVRPSQPVERLRTGGKVRSSPVSTGGPSPKKRGRPRIPDATSEPVPAEGSVGGSGSLTYDSFWNSLGTMKGGSA
ncbi:hypothetical protein RhiJN_26761 [Ceratobasidium sp. AG-Ba]|nr:hypothetical protein RhiJN_26761 [Ceratobasidium sp. AG-Ba]